MLIMKRRNGAEWKGKNDIRCQGTMENWDVEIFTFFVPVWVFIYGTFRCCSLSCLQGLHNIINVITSNA